jgi:competence ComEA-like helix-hairpin-helix protein
LLFWLLLCLIFVAASSAATKKPPLKPSNINAAGSEELQRVVGIGPATAEKILLTRKSYGSLKSIDDLLAIKGLGRKRLDKVRKDLTVGKAAAVIHPQSSAPKRRSAHSSAPPASTELAEPPSREKDSFAGASLPLLSGKTGERVRETSYSTWCVVRFCSMRSGTWSAIVMP